MCVLFEVVCTTIQDVAQVHNVDVTSSIGKIVCTVEILLYTTCIYTYTCL